MDRLLEDVSVVETRGELGAVDVQSLEFDSRHVQPGALFFCLTGVVSDGHDFAAAAVDRGAVALVVERRLGLDVAQVVVAPGMVRSVMARMAGTQFGHPADALVTVGVTGTNGKTTVSHLVADILRFAGLPTTVVGTLEGERTTPEAPVLQRIMADARDSGKKALSMEVSSHALTQSRVEGFRFDAAAFTNLSHDHLDHHGTMEAYYGAKASLFQPERAAQGVVNADDEWGRRLLVDAGIPTISYTMAEVNDVVSAPGRTTFVWRGRPVELALAGTHQVVNALCAATTAVAIGISEDDVVAGLGTSSALPGRFEIVVGTPVTVVVDFAHTPEALATALDSARQMSVGHRVICVFGCGGDRDHAKRPVMAEIATHRADVTVITSDNPRNEDPATIIDEVVAGATGPSTLIVEPDRRRAIVGAVNDAADGDVVLVAGKGHETYIEVGGHRTPFSDRDEAVAAVTRRGVSFEAGEGRPR